MSYNIVFMTLLYFIYIHVNVYIGVYPENCETNDYRVAWELFNQGASTLEPSFLRNVDAPGIVSYKSGQT